MKRKCFPALLLSLALLCTCLPVSAEAEEMPVLSFLALSDLHLDEGLFQTSDTNIAQYQRLLDAGRAMGIDTLVCGGDISSYGNTDYWYTAREMAEESGYTQTCWALGNHAYGTSGVLTNVAQKFCTFAGTDSIYYTREIGGVCFLFLAVDHGDITDFGNFASTQLAWFSDALQQAAERSPGKPIFVISHFALFTGKVRELLGEELKKYDNVFFLWGHEHGSALDGIPLEGIFVDEGGFISGYMGSTNYYYSKTADGAAVRVYDDRVELQFLRVGGKQLSPDTLTVSLKKPADWSVERESAGTGTTAKIVLGNREESGTLFAALYDASGRMLEVRSGAVSAGDAVLRRFAFAAGGTEVRAFWVSSQGLTPLRTKMLE